MKRYLTGMFLACLFYPTLLNAQSEIDALRYSQSFHSPTARSMGMSGAFGALGGDFSTLSINPAGLGVYRSSEFSLSFGGINRSSESFFQGNKSTKDKFNMTFGNIGLVLTKTMKKKDSPWKQFSFGLGHNRTNDLGSEIYYEGMNYQNSITDFFAEKVNLDGGADAGDLGYFYPYDVNLAYQTYLIDPDQGNPGNYISIIPNGRVKQSRRYSSKGNMGEFSFALGANYNNKINFGLSLAFPSVKFEDESVYEEHDIDNSVVNSDSTDFKSLRYSQYLTTTGNGFNAKFGIIVRVTDGIRLGAAIHTPTFYNLSDKYYSTMQSIVDNTTHSATSPEGTYSYKLETPMKFVGSFALIFAKTGLLSLDYEFTNYSSNKLKSSDYNFAAENNNINTLYSDASHTIRAGAEFRQNAFSFRLGAAYYGSPFDSKYTDESYDQHVESYSAGIGFRKKALRLDLGYSYSTRSEYYSAYYLENEEVPGAIIKKTDNRFMLTLGFRF